MVCVLSVAACGLFTSPSVEVAGRFVLFKRNSDSLPAKIVELPNSIEDPTPSGCWYTLTEGEFGIIGADHTFGYFVTYRNSCGWYVLYSGGTSGHYVQSGSMVQFQPPAGTAEFVGHIIVDTLVVIRGG